MRQISIVSLILVTLLGVGAAYWIDAAEKPRRHWPKPTPPPPPSPIYTTSREHVQSQEEIAQQARDHNGLLELEIESALMGKDAQRREGAFTFLLPELVQVDPPRVVAMVARQPPGEARDTLRTEVTRQWMARDPDAAVRWMKTLPEGERRESAAIAVESIIGHSPIKAAALADEFGITGLLAHRLKAARD
ncbi:MAG TPA: hypothetical protein VEW08_11660 [Steroidobacteraceae bacterium]|nr:hypothetical protein [Steroidobacteraceae bacterium]